jgi:hypothetical protein
MTTKIQSRKVRTTEHHSGSGKYVMTISRLTVDKLGVKLYDRVAAVIAELVANSYDADATEVTIEAPMGAYLASVQNGKLVDHNHKIVVSDNGFGMVPEVVNKFYLKVGAERRKDPERGDRSPKYRRKVMGRKGVGKLAPFGICKTIEVISSGGKKVEGINEKGKPARGYLTAHFIMNRDDIMTEQETNYEPTVGALDKTVRPKPGTVLILSDFIRRQVPETPSFARQLAQRFGIRAPNWRVTLIDSLKTKDSKDRTAEVGEFEIAKMESTEIVLQGPSSGSVDVKEKEKYRAIGPNGKAMHDLQAGFVHTDGRFYPIRGWVAYAQQSYRDELMAGIRIYCRGKIAAQTNVFNRKSGFTGEYNVRTYLVGEIEADWLDEGEDLIQTDRRDILWSDDLGQAFEKWGQDVVEKLGTLSREPLKKKVWEEFLEVGNVVQRVESAYPGERWKPIRETTMRIAKLMGERLRPGEVADREHVDSLVQLSLMLGPHVTLDDTLREAAADEKTPLAAVAAILRTARVAELSSYGMIAEKRVQVIEKVIGLKDDADTLEQALQELIEEAPWLINPQWSPITANQTLTNLRREFEKFYKKETKQNLVLSSFEIGKRRPDFVLSSQDFGLQIIEIKKPAHKLQNDEWERIQTYIDQMTRFLELPGHEEFRRIFKTFTVTLVCDEIGLTGSARKAFDAYKVDRTVEHVTWTAFLRRTEHMHREFLAEADRQRELAIRS